MSTLRTKSQVLNELRQGGIVPVIRADSSAIAVKIAEALVAGGITTLEITMTVPDAIRVMSSIAHRFGSRILLGAGTITTPQMADAAVDAGCAFLVTPCLLPEVIARARARRVPVLAGALTPTEVFAAHAAGADFIKVFPAGAVGGPDYLRALRGPFPDIDLVPTGGITLLNAGEYIRAGAAAIGVGGELISREAIAAKDFSAIGALGRQFIEAVSRARLREGIPS